MKAFHERRQPYALTLTLPWPRFPSWMSGLDLLLTRLLLSNRTYSTPNGLYPFSNCLSWYPWRSIVTDRTSPTFLTNTVSSAQITAFRNQKKSTASYDIVSFHRKLYKDPDKGSGLRSVLRKKLITSTS